MDNLPKHAWSCANCLHRSSGEECHGCCIDDPESQMGSYWVESFESIHERADKQIVELEAQLVTMTCNAENERLAKESLKIENTKLQTGLQQLVNIVRSHSKPGDDTEKLIESAVQLLPDNARTTTPNEEIRSRWPDHGEQIELDH